MGKPGDLLARVLGAPFRAVLGRYPWLKWVLILVPLLLLLALFEPAVRVLGKLVELLVGALAPLLDNPTGRVVLLNVLLVGAVLVGWRALRRRIGKTLSSATLRRHLQGVADLVHDAPRRARELFRRVSRSRAAPSPDYPWVREDAKLKLARLALEKGELDAAFGWLARVRDKDLPKELRRSLVQLRAECYLAQGEVLPETVEAALREAVRQFPDDVRLLSLLRRVVLARGDVEEAVRLQERVAERSPPRRRPAARRTLIEDLLRAGSQALREGDASRARRHARRARALDPEGAAASCLLGEVKLAAGDVRGAVREWGRTRSPQGLERIAELLADRPGVLSPREILECCPTEGALLVVAREYVRLGEPRRALRAARRAARALGPTPTVSAVLAEVLAACGRLEEAQRICDETVLRLVESPRGVSPEPDTV